MIGDAWLRVHEDVCTELAAAEPAIDPSTLQRAVTATIDGFPAHYGDDWTLGRLSGAAIAHHIWVGALDVAGYRDAGLLDTVLQLEQRAAARQFTAFDDVAGLRDATTAAGIPVALVTNGASDSQRGKLAAAGITSWFAGLAISGELGVAKPDPAVFAPALATVDASAGDRGVWHVGDNLAADVAGANAAGITSVWLNRAGAARGVDDAVPALEVTGLTALLPHLSPT